jgi:hypothetical protein
MVRDPLADKMTIAESSQNPPTPPMMPYSTACPAEDLRSPVIPKRPPRKKMTVARPRAILHETLLSQLQ